MNDIKLWLGWRYGEGSWRPGHKDVSVTEVCNSYDYPSEASFDVVTGIFSVSAYINWSELANKLAKAFNKKHNLPASSGIQFAFVNEKFQVFSDPIDVTPDLSLQLKNIIKGNGGVNTPTMTESPKSQKILGLFALDRFVETLRWNYGRRLPSDVILKETQLKDFTVETEMFARGCPLRPRHGFVDSRPISSPKELRKVWDEVRAADPDGELLLSSYVDSSHNVVWTPGAMSVGPGHDGATAGRNSLMIPLVKGKWLESNGYKTLIKEAKIADNEVPYIEAVFKKKPGNDIQWYATQARSGPEINASSPDYIPEVITVGEVIEAEGDLLEWEERAKAFKPGTVIWHSGGTLASHYAVHCVNHKIPYITTKKPVVGQVLEAIKADTALNLDMFIKGVIAGFRVPLPDRPSWQRATTFVIVALHQTAGQRGPNSWAAGAAAALMCRIGLALSLGELRHSSASAINGEKIAASVTGLSRDQIYAKALNDYFVYRFLHAHVVDSYFNFNWSTSYGGARWGECALAVAELVGAILQLMREPTETNAKHLIDRLNSAVNQAHNGGWWLNKILFGNALDYASQTNFASSILAAPMYYEVFKELNAPKSEQTVAPLLKILPIIPVSREKRKLKRVKTKKVVDSTVDVPQKYDLSYPTILVDTPEMKDDPLKLKIERFHVRVIGEEKLSVRFQVKWVVTKGVTTGGSYSEWNVKVPEETWKWVANSKATSKSFYGSGAMYVPLEDFQVVSNDNSFTISKKLPGEYEVKQFLEHGGMALLTKKAQAAVINPWWQPGVKIPVTFSPVYKTVTYEEEVYTDGTPVKKSLIEKSSGVPDKKCLSCGELVDQKHLVGNGSCKWCDETTCDDCGDTISHYDSSQCGHAGQCCNCAEDGDTEEDQSENEDKG
jgi:hypothetical protein